MDHLRITVEGKSYDVIVERIGSEAAAPANPRPAVATPAAITPAAPVPAAVVSTPTPAAKSAAGAGDAVSPLAGIVQAIEGSVGTTVAAGDLVITLEAMKMYTPINAVSAGTITAIHVKVGDAVEEGQVLYTVA
jgi:glutaconyl-CoA/methylmalonyl-CoA decarboxylase subunit gamma